jgi:hypothetical protein
MFYFEVTNNLNKIEKNPPPLSVNKTKKEKRFSPKDKIK